MRRMLDPTTIAVIGASETEGSVGRTIMENAMASAGRTVYPINPKHPTILGLTTHASIGDIAEEIDLAMVATPAATVPDVLAQCAAAGVHGAIVVSAGFSETGEQGAELDARIRDILRTSPMRVVGPNCLGIIRPTVGLNASFLSINPEPGNIALISQSGALGTGMLDWAIDAHIGFSMFASVGGMVDVDFADLVDFLGEDEQTRSILIYMESIGNARRFMSAARGFARNKPIIVLKPGRYAESARAALSHTGSMAGGDEIYEAAFRREGVVRVHEVADLFHAAAVLDSARLPKGRDVAIVTNAGGLGVMATDALVEHGGRLACLSDATMAALNEALPAYWSHANPIDVLGDAGSERFTAAVQACLDDPAVNGILLIYTPQGNARPDEMATAGLGTRSGLREAADHGAHGWRDRAQRATDLQRCGRAKLRDPRRCGQDVSGHVSLLAQPRAALRDPLRARHRRRPASPQPPGDASTHRPHRTTRAHRGGVEALLDHLWHARGRTAHDARRQRGAGGRRGDRLSGGAQDRLARHHPQERCRRRRGRHLLAAGSRARLRRDSHAREGERARRPDRGHLGAEDGAPHRLRADPRDEEGPAVRLGDRLWHRRRARRGAGGLLGEPAATQSRAGSADDGGDAHLSSRCASRHAGSSRRTWALSTR